MIETLAIVALAFLWTVLVGELSLTNLAFGAVLGLVLMLLVEQERRRSFPRRLLAGVRFVAQFLAELVVANVVVARLAFLPRPRFHPHIVAVPLRVRSDAAISLLSATITLLPGTVALGLSEDRRILYAHAIGEADPQRSRDSVTRIESLILGFMT